MSGRLFQVLGVAAVLLLVVLLLKFARTAPDARTTSAGTSPATAWGEPDLQGIWTRATNEPLQRPARFKDRESLTDEERAELNNKITDIVGRESDENRRPRGTEQDVSGGYSAAVFTSHLPVGRRTSMIVDPADGRIPPLTAQEQKKRTALREYAFALLQATDVCKNKLLACTGWKYGPPSSRRAEAPPSYIVEGIIGGGGGGINRSDGPEDRILSERCLSSSLPDFGGFRRIVQSKGQVAIFYDVGQGQGWQRVIPITASPHLPANVRLWWGDSRGRWEGNTLVVDVTNFSPKSNFQGAHENLHLVERWTRTDAETLQYTVTIEDATVWTRPWTVTLDLKKQDDKANRLYAEPRCHEGNYGLATMLAGAREDERAFIAGRGPDPATKCLAGCGGFAGGFAEEGDDANPVR
jgi:hypothetical protein